MAKTLIAYFPMQEKIILADISAPSVKGIRQLPQSLYKKQQAALCLKSVR